MNEERLAELLEERIGKLIEERTKNLLEENNNKLLEKMDALNDKIDGVDEKLSRRLDKVEADNKTLYEKIVDMGFYFEENYGSKIKAIFDKLQLNDQMQSIQKEKIKEHIEHTNALLMSHDVRITNLEKAVNSKQS